MTKWVSDRETLVAALRKQGVDWLAPSDAVGEPLSDETLIGSLALHEDSRLRAALTGLFLIRAHPHLANKVQAILDELPDSARDELIARYMAAVYLQRLWRTRLARFVGHSENLPDLFSGQLELHAADVDFGRPGLHDLADWHQAQLPVAYDRLSEYSRQIDFVFAALETRERGQEPADLLN